MTIALLKNVIAQTEIKNGSACYDKVLKII